MIKNYSALFLLLLVISFYNCNNNVDTTNQEIANIFEIHLQGGFSYTPVKVRVDYSQIFSDTVTTIPALEVADIIPAQIYKGTHSLSITVADSITNDTTFTINDTLYIGVNYSPTTFRITYNFRHLPFRYR